MNIKYEFSKFLDFYNLLYFSTLTFICQIWQDLPEIPYPEKLN